MGKKKRKNVINKRFWLHGYARNCYMHTTQRNPKQSSLQGREVGVEKGSQAMIRPT